MEQKNEKTGSSRRKALQVIASILVAIAVWVYVDVEKAPDRTKTIRDIPVEFSGESTTLADKNLMHALTAALAQTLALQAQSARVSNHCSLEKTKAASPIGEAAF